MPGTIRALPALGAVALALLGVSACVDGTDLPAGEEIVGTTVMTWSAGSVAEEVEAPADTILRSPQEYRDWLEGLTGPPELVEALEADLDLQSSVAVVASFYQCDNALRLVTDGTGAIAAQTYDPTPEDTFDCAESPLTVTLFEVGLDELGVDSADDARLVEDLGGDS